MAYTPIGGTTNKKKKGYTPIGSVQRNDVSTFLPSISELGVNTLGMKSTTPSVMTEGEQDTKKFVAEVAGYPLRAGLKAGLTLKPEIGTINPREDLGSYAAYFLGDAPIESGQNEIPIVEENLRAKGYGPLSGPIAYTGITGDIALSLLPLVGSLEKQGIKTLSTVLAKIENPRLIEEVLVKHGVEAPLAREYSLTFGPMEKASDIEAGLLNLEKMQSTTKTGGNYTPISSSKSDPLITEARKYDSAEEFERSMIGREKIDSGQVKYIKEPRTYYREAAPSDVGKMITGSDTSSRRYFSEDIDLALGQKESASGIIVKLRDSGEIIPRGNGTAEISKFNPARIESVLIPESKLTPKAREFYEANGFDVVNAAPAEAGVTREGIKYLEIKNKNFVENPRDLYNTAKGTASKDLPLPPTLTNVQRVSQTAPLPERTATQDLEKILLQTPDGRTSKALQPKGIEAQTPSGPVELSSTQNIPQSRVVQGEEATTKKPVVLDNSVYEANRGALKKEKLVEVRKGLNKTFGSIGKGADVLLGSISTRLEKINPLLKSALRNHENNIMQAVQNDHRRVAPFLRALKKSKITAGDYADLDLALKNGDATKTAEVLKKYGLEDSFKEIRGTLDDLYKRAKSVGYDIGYEENYFPRTIKDSGGLLEYLEKGEDWSILDEAIKAREAAYGYMNTDEKAAFINSLIRGYGEKITLSETGAMKARKIDIVDANLNQFYDDSVGSLLSYIDNTNDAIEARRFFGKGVPKEKSSNIQDSIGAYILNLMADGKIKPSQEKELTSILRARFNETGTSGFVNTYKNLAYIDTMGSPISAITQIGDLAPSLYLAGPFRTVGSLASAVAGKSKITTEMVGIKKIAAEFNDRSVTSEWVSTVFKVVGLEKMDSLGKETLMNAYFKKMSDQARKPNAEFYQRLEGVFGEDVDAIARTVEDLKAGRVTEDTKLLVLNRLMDFQPIALSEMPEMYLKGKNGRIFYMLKTYTVKQFDIYRNEVFKTMKTNKPRAIRNLMALAAAYIFMNATADEIKDLLLNRETKLSDRVVDNILRLGGISKYTLYKGREEGIVSAVARTILPPFKAADAIWKDVTRQNELGQLEIVDSIPLLGKPYYWWFGRGADKTEKKRKANDTSDNSPIPELPSLPQLPKLPRLPSI